MKFEFSDQIGHRDRKSMLVFISNERVVRFRGETIDGVAVIVSSSYKKAGKWSHTTYQLEVAEEYKPVVLKETWGEGEYITRFETLEAMANQIGLGVVRMDVVASFIQEHLPSSWKQFKAVQESLDGLVGKTHEWRDMVLENTFLSRRSGRLHTFVDGQEWDYLPIEGKLVIFEQKVLDGCTRYHVRVAPGVVIESKSTRVMLEEKWKAEATELSLPTDLMLAFEGDVEKVREFFSLVEGVKGYVDEHLISCGRDKLTAEIIRASGNQNFFLGADPKDVQSFLRNHFYPQGGSLVSVSSVAVEGSSSMAEALKRAGYSGN